MNSGRILSDLMVFSRGYVRSRIGVFFGLVFPVILILIFGAIFSGGSSGPITVYARNQDSSAQASDDFIKALNSTGTLRLVLVNSSQDLSEYLLSHSSSDGISIPEGFSADFVSGKAVNVTVYGDPASTTSAITSGITNGVINAFNLRRAGGSPIIALQQLTVKSQSYKYIDFLVPGLVGFSVLTSPMFALVSISSQYKRDKIFKQLSLTPLRKSEWLTAKIIFYIMLDSVRLRYMLSEYDILLI